MQFAEYLRICKKIKFDEKPDDEKLKDCFRSVVEEYNLDSNLKYMWSRNEDK